MASSPSSATSSTAKLKRAVRICFDFLIFAGLCVAEYAVNKWMEPFKRGFFCGDDSLRYPRRDATVTRNPLVAIVLVVPFLVIVSVELFRRLETIADRRKTAAGGGGGGYRLWVRLQRCYAQFGFYLFGLALAVLSTELSKRFVGRLRPHFFAVCQPQLPDGTTCEEPGNYGRYVADYTCLGQNQTERAVEQVGMSFPSGHASIMFYGMVYVAIYLQAVLTTRVSRLLKHLLQFVFVMAAWYVALTRISDFAHHWTDVLVGVALGCALAFYVACCVAHLFRHNFGGHLNGCGGSGRVQVKPAGGPAASIKSAPATAVLPAYTFGTMPYMPHPHHQYAQSYHNYGYVP